MKELKSIVNAIAPEEYDAVRMMVTQDGDFDRDAIMITPANADGQIISMDVLVNLNGEIYHVARMNFTVLDDGKTNIDIIPPDDAEQDILVFSEGAIKVNWRSLSNKQALLAFVSKPKKSTNAIY